MCISPVFWIANMLFSCYFLKMSFNYLEMLSIDFTKFKQNLIKCVFFAICLLQIYGIIADDFIILFVSGYIFQDIEFVYKHLPAIDFVMTLFSEQINSMNALTVLCIIHYFA